MPKVVIERAGNLLSLSPSCVEQLKSTLSYKALKYEQKRGVSKVSHHIVRLYSVNEGKLFAPAGLLQRIVARLKDRGFEVEYIDHRTKIFPDPDLSRVDVSGLKDGQDRALVKIFSSDMGQIEAPTAFGKSYLICQVCQAYPESKIVICAQQASSGWRKLREEEGGRSYYCLHRKIPVQSRLGQDRLSTL